MEGVYAGLRPLLTGEEESTSKLSREHVVGHPVPGLVVVAGGKFTTYRVMAADAVDEAVRSLDARIPDSCTAELPLIGADGYRPLWNQRRALAVSAGIARRPGRAPAQPVRRLHHRAARADPRRPVARRRRCPARTTTSRSRPATR